VAVGEQRLGPRAPEVAGDPFVSETTVKTHVARIFAKLGARDLVQAVDTVYADSCDRAADRVSRAPVAGRSPPRRRYRVSVTGG
jgi:hypothetical protein